MCPQSQNPASITCPLDNGVVEEVEVVRTKLSPCSGGDEQSRLDSWPLETVPL